MSRREFQTASVIDPSPVPYEWETHCDALTALRHGVPQAVLPQIITEDPIAAFLPPSSLVIKTIQDAAGCVAAVYYSDAYSDIDYSRFVELPYLHTLLFCDRDDMTTAALRHLSRIPKLKTLLLARCHNVTLAAVEELLEFPNLTELELNECDGIDDQCMEIIGTIPRLSHITLSGDNRYPRALFDLRDTPNLTSIRFSDLDGPKPIDLQNLLPTTEATSAIPPPAMTSVRVAFAQLTALHFTWCKLGAASTAVISQLPSLTELEFWNCLVLDDDALEPLCSLPLETLVLNSCPAVGRRGLASIAKIATLRRLHVGGCRKIQARDLEPFRAVVPCVAPWFA